MSNKKVLKVEKQEIVDNKRNDEVFNFADFKKNLKINIASKNQDSLEMQINGIDASITNAIRRIIISQIPTMAFHKVLLYQNTSVLPDELLVHRVGLLPINVDSKKFIYKKQDQEWSGENSLKFELKALCKKKQKYQKYTQEQLQAKKIKPEQYLENANVYANQIKWVPQGNQLNQLKNVEVLHSNILIAKLRQNQQINFEIYAEKGIGKKHAKWSPVSTCFYRLMPDIEINSTFNHQKNAQTLVSCCPVNVFKLKKGKAVVQDARSCTTCRQCIALDGVELGKIKDNFIFTIESIGVYKSEQIFLQALEILEEKAKAYVI